VSAGEGKAGFSSGSYEDEGFPRLGREGMVDAMGNKEHNGEHGQIKSVYTLRGEGRNRADRSEARN